MSLTDWEQLAKIVQGFATGVAIIVGALWALFRFWSLREVKQVKLRLEQQQRELQEQPVLDLTMRAEQVTVDDDGHYVTVTVVAKNNGNQIARMAYEGKPALRVFYVDYLSDGAPAYHEQQTLHVRLASNPNDYAKTTIVRPGQTQEIPFHLNLSATGWYFLAFRAVLSEQDRQMLLQAGVLEHRIISWTAKKYVYVKSA